jgi:hypothetical protein
MTAQWTPLAEAVEAAAEASWRHPKDAMSEVAWANVHPTVRETYRREARAVLAAARGPLMAEMREEIAREIEVDDAWFDPSDGLHHAEPFRAGVEAAQASAARIARGADQ